MKYVFTVVIETDDLSVAEEIRSDMAGAWEDFRDRERPDFDVEVGDPEAIESDRHGVLIDLARERYRDNIIDVEVDDSARLSEADSGCWVQGWLWVPRDMMLERGIVDQPANEPVEACESEGGHCD